MGPRTSGLGTPWAWVESVMPQTYCTSACQSDERTGRSLWTARDDFRPSPPDVLLEEVHRPVPGVRGHLGVVLRRRGVVEEGVPYTVVDPRREVDAGLRHPGLQLRHPVRDAVVVLAVEGQDRAGDRAEVGLLGEAAVEGDRCAQARLGRGQGERIRPAEAEAHDADAPLHARL